MPDAAEDALDVFHENVTYHADEVTMAFEETSIGALERRARATPATTTFLHELHSPRFVEDGDADWASHIAQIADALEVKETLAGMLAAGSDGCD